MTYRCMDSCHNSRCTHSSPPGLWRHIGHCGYPAKQQDKYRISHKWEQLYQNIPLWMRKSELFKRLNVILLASRHSPQGPVDGAGYSDHQSGGLPILRLRALLRLMMSYHNKMTTSEYDKVVLGRVARSGFDSCVDDLSSVDSKDFISRHVRQVCSCPWKNLCTGGTLTTRVTLGSIIPTALRDARYFVDDGNPCAMRIRCLESSGAMRMRCMECSCAMRMRCLEFSGAMRLRCMESLCAMRMRCIDDHSPRFGDKLMRDDKRPVIVQFQCVGEGGVNYSRLHIRNLLFSYRSCARGVRMKLAFRPLCSSPTFNLPLNCYYTFVCRSVYQGCVGHI